MAKRGFRSVAQRYVLFKKYPSLAKKLEFLGKETKVLFKSFKKNGDESDMEKASPLSRKWDDYYRYF